jgi:hypothetical protein
MILYGRAGQINQQEGHIIRKDLSEDGICFYVYRKRKRRMGGGGYWFKLEHRYNKQRPMFLFHDIKCEQYSQTL